MTDLQNNTPRAVLTCSLFLHAGYVGAVTTAAGLIQLLAGEASWPSALALILFGVLLATVSWRRARAIVEAADRAPAVAAHLRRPDLAKPFESSLNPAE